MLARLPRQLPLLSLMLDNLGNPSAETVARALGVGVRTVRRWIADDAAPRPALLALFWLTRWGASELECDAHNAATMAASHVTSLKAENAALRAALARRDALAGYGSANDPDWRQHLGPTEQLGPRLHSSRPHCSVIPRTSPVIGST